MVEEDTQPRRVRRDARQACDSTENLNQNQAMHPQMNPPKPERYTIVSLADGQEKGSRATYWLALLHAYSIMRMGTFTIERR